MKFPSIAALLVMTSAAFAEDRLLPWDTDTPLLAYSRTATSITGDIALTGPPEARLLTFETGADMGLSPVGRVMSNWVLGGDEHWLGAVYAVKDDPGGLKNGNWLCGADQPATFVVFSAQADFVLMAVYSGARPENADAPNLCATFTYTVP